MSTEPTISGASATSLQECAQRLEDPAFFRRVCGLGAGGISSRLDLPSRATIDKYCTRPEPEPEPMPTQAKSRPLAAKSGHNDDMPSLSHLPRATEAEIATIRRLASTHTRTQIAKIIKRPYTSIIGLCMRYGIECTHGWPKGRRRSKAA
jgi:hypothetical protein